MAVRHVVDVGGARLVRGQGCAEATHTRYFAPAGRVNT